MVSSRNLCSHHFLPLGVWSSSLCYQPLSQLVINVTMWPWQNGDGFGWLDVPIHSGTQPSQEWYVLVIMFENCRAYTGVVVIIPVSHPIDQFSVLNNQLPSSGTPIPKKLIVNSFSILICSLRIWDPPGFHGYPKWNTYLKTLHSGLRNQCLEIISTSLGYDGFAGLSLINIMGIFRA